MYAECTIPAKRFDLDRWMKTPTEPWTSAMESHGIHWVDLSASEATCRGAESDISLELADYNRREKEEWSHRRQHDLRLPTV